MTQITKILGWIMFIIGLGIVIWAIFYSYNIFTGKTAAPDIFKMAETTESTSQTKGKIPTTEEELQQQLQAIMGEQLKGLLPTDTLPKLLNLIAWSVGAWILFIGGGQIAGLGIKLMKSQKDSQS